MRGGVGHAREVCGSFANVGVSAVGVITALIVTAGVITALIVAVGIVAVTAIVAVFLDVNHGKEKWSKMLWFARSCRKFLKAHGVAEVRGVGREAVLDDTIIGVDPCGSSERLVAEGLSGMRERSLVAGEVESCLNIDINADDC